MKKLFITSVLFAAAIPMLSAQEVPGLKPEQKKSEEMKGKADSAVKKSDDKVGEEKKEHHNYRDTFNEHNKNKGGESKDKKAENQDKSKPEQAVSPGAKPDKDAVTAKDKKDKKKDKQKKAKTKKSKEKKSDDLEKPENKSPGTGQAKFR